MNEADINQTIIKIIVNHCIIKTVISGMKGNWYLEINTRIFNVGWKGQEKFFKEVTFQLKSTEQVHGRQAKGKISCK